MNVKELFDLSGKNAVVTGGSVGLGAQIAEAFAEAGANVVIAARKVERCEALCEKLSTLGIKAVPAACDVSKEEDCQKLVEKTVSELGSIDILVNNAGISWVTDSLNFPMDKWQKVMGLNINGTFQLSAIAAREMKTQGSGKIINIASIGGLGGDMPENVDSVAYTTSKGAVINMTRDLGVKWARYGINVNAICPGWFPTSLNDKLLEDRAPSLIPKIPLNRYGSKDDLKGAAIYLASAASNYVTGQYIVVDGGQTAWV
ncbi:MAG: SDR family oxidoreductase [Spirochaetales bacterium]|nr:SDR family oxidoreductase [Spirochaetales bacterium]